MRRAPETLAEARKADRITRRRHELADAVELRATADASIARAVAGLRRDGVSWTTIAHELGVTKQAAQRRFGQRTLTVKRPPDDTPLFDLEAASEAHSAV